MATQNTEMVKVPVFIFERLLQSYYFEKSCHHFNIKEWEKYKDVDLYQTRMAVNDIMYVNKEE